MTVTKPVIDYALTAEDITALRTADSVAFHHHLGMSMIRTHLRGGYIDNPRVYTAKEQRIFPETSIGTDGDRTRTILTKVHMRGYRSTYTLDTSNWYLEGNHSACAFHIEHNAQSSPPWQTIAGLVRAGDIIRLVWLADNNSDSVRAAALHMDELRLSILRDGHTVKYSFLVEKQVGPDNSARMIKRHG